MQQVDDFAITSTDKAICQEIILHLDSAMTMKIKVLGLVTYYNGVNVDQTQEYIKIHSHTYIQKICKAHGWDTDETPLHTFPLPMNSEKSYLKQLDDETDNQHIDPDDLELQKGFSYRQAIGELIYAMVTTRPDISFPVIKLSQFTTRPLPIHYDAVKHIFLYLRATSTHGIYYWRQKLVMGLPAGQKPTVKDDPYKPTMISTSDSTELIGFSDSDWAGDTRHRRSVTGVAVIYAGGVVCYKTKYQETIALSSTEAEFVALCDAGKVVLYARSILDDLAVSQENATTLYKDN